jgi:hypothetical protein
MAFKMTGMSFGKGTGSAKGLPKKRGASLSASDPAYERFVQKVASGEKEWSDHPDYNPDYEYDRYGNPITDVKSPKTTNLGTSDHVFGSIDTSVTSGDKGRQVEEEPTQKRIDKAISKYRKAEQLHGAGNVSRGDMTDADFDILLNYGGSENYGGSWIQERMINAAKGAIDSEPHLQGKYSDMQMYPNLKEGETPKLRKVQKNFANMYQDIMNDPANADFVGGYSDSAGVLDKKTAKNIAKDLIPDLGLTSTSTSLRPGEVDNLTNEQEDAEVAEVEKEMESDEFNEYVNQDDTMEEGGKEEETPVVREDEYAPQSTRKEYIPQSQRKEEDAPVVVEENTDDTPVVEDDIVTDDATVGTEQSFDSRDTNQDGTVDRKEKRAAMFADSYDPQSSAMSKKPVFGTDEYYDFMKKKRTKEMGLTKRMFNIYDKD